MRAAIQKYCAQRAGRSRLNREHKRQHAVGALKRLLVSVRAAWLNTRQAGAMRARRPVPGAFRAIAGL
jgi:hypothetical protein